MDEKKEERELYRVTVALPGASAGDHVLVDTSDPEIVELIEATFLVKVDAEEPQKASEELAEASAEPAADADEIAKPAEPVDEQESLVEPGDEDGALPGPFASHPR